MDIIFLRELRVETVIGIYDWERCKRQTVSIDLEMGSDIRKAAASDSIEDTLNYKAVAKRLLGFIEASEFQLVETLAEREGLERAFAITGHSRLVTSPWPIPTRYGSMRMVTGSTMATRGSRLDHTSSGF